MLFRNPDTDLRVLERRYASEPSAANHTLFACQFAVSTEEMLRDVEHMNVCVRLIDDDVIPSA